MTLVTALGDSGRSLFVLRDKSILGPSIIYQALCFWTKLVTGFEQGSQSYMPVGGMHTTSSCWGTSVHLLHESSAVSVDFCFNYLFKMKMLGGLLVAEGVSVQTIHGITPREPV